MANSRLADPRRRSRSRVWCACAALSWAGWLVAAPSAWTGCQFELSGFFGTWFKVIAADDVDLSKVDRIYLKLLSPDQGEYEVEKPAGGWPKEVQAHYVQQNAGEYDFTVTAYDHNGNLMALGHNDMQDHIVVTVSATIPWN